ncbi:hypothetical protein TIFTF001_031904 [Ficus carica]|uniref:Uncharacterized protein n=1 Tax=Ficus carica TaxID=3494 RepID=A0AA88J1P7_FICCA|nr:hypothetical protein TIFTF001_031904 [Ficus carica]
MSVRSSDERWCRSRNNDMYSDKYRMSGTDRPARDPRKDYSSLVTSSPLGRQKELTGSYAPRSLIHRWSPMINRCLLPPPKNTEANPLK